MSTIEICAIVLSIASVFNSLMCSLIYFQRRVIENHKLDYDANMRTMRFNLESLRDERDELLAKLVKKL